jgi:hypothetical protein
MEEGGLATVWNEANTNESNTFYYDDENGAVDAALSTIPDAPEALPYGEELRAKSKGKSKTPVNQWSPKQQDRLLNDVMKAPKDKKIRKVPQFSEEDKISLHGLGVKGALKPVWDKAIFAGMIQFSSNRYSFTKSATAPIRLHLKDTVVRVNSALNRRHIPKSAAAHEAAAKEIAKLVVASNRKLDKMGSLAKKAAHATHVLYDAGPESYTVRVMRGNDTIDEYNGGNSPYDSMSQFNRTDNDAIEYKRLLEFAEQTAKEYAQEYGIPENMIDHDEDLMAEERENAGMDFTSDDNAELRGMGIKPDADVSEVQEQKNDVKKFDSRFLRDNKIKGSKNSSWEDGKTNENCPRPERERCNTNDDMTCCGGGWEGPCPCTTCHPKKASSKPKCPHCGSTKYALMPTDFETAKCEDCGKNWDHGIVDGINNPKTAVFSPEEADKFQQEHGGSNIVLNEDTQGGAAPESDAPLTNKAASKKTANVYPVVKEKNGEWYIRGLPSKDWSESTDEGDVVKEKPDTFIIPGMHYSTNTPSGLIEGLYVSLYDEFQVNDALKEGDIFDTSVGQFVCEGVHVVPYDEKAKAAVATVNDSYRCANCGCDKGDHRVSYEDGGEDYYECKNHPLCKEYRKKK